MLFLEDLQLNRPIPCGEFEFSQRSIVDFASHYDPQPFHLSDEGGKASLFGRLTASGMQSASAARHLVLKALLSRTRFLGSPGAIFMQMRSPVWPGRKITVTHTFKSIVPVAGRPGVAAVDGVTRGIDSAGVSVIEINDLNWIGSRTFGATADLPDLAHNIDASAALGPFKRLGGVLQTPPDDSRLFFEHCPVGRIFASADFTIDEAAELNYRRTFDARHEDGSTLRNEWHAPSVGIRIMADTFLLRSMNMGGPGLELVRWPSGLSAGDHIRGEMKVVDARPLKSRPHVGLLKAEHTCANQRGEMVASYAVTTFIRKLP